MRAYFCQKIVAVSFGVKQKLVNLWHYPQEKIVVCHHGVDTGRFRRNPYTIGLKKGKERTVIAVSRLSKEKCVDRVIDAFDRLASLDDHLKLIILGSGPLEAQLQQLAAGKKHQARIKLIGHVQDTSDYLLKADYFVLSSDYEGLGISLLEAMSCGLICLSTRCAGPTEIIEEGINGLFIQKSAQGVQEGLEKALGLSGEQARSMGHRAMETVAGKFELNRNVRKVFDIFEVPYAENQRDRHHDTVILDSLYA